MATRSITHVSALALGLFMAAGCPATEDPEATNSSTVGAESSSTTANVDTTTESSGGSETAGSNTTTATTTPTSTTSAETSDTDTSECGAAAACAEPPTPGWFGPIIYSRAVGGAPPLECPELYTELGPTVLEGYHDPGPAICECDCTLNAAQACSAYAYGHSNSSCNTYNPYVQVTENCSNANLPGYATFYTYLQNQPTCMQMKTETIPPVQWDATVHSCKLDATVQTCGEGGTGLCAPIPPDDFEANLCIYKQGDTECPAGEYGTKRSFYTSVEDSRDCTNCACGAAPVNCTASMLVFNGADCAGNPVSSVASNGPCTAATGGSVAMEIDQGSGCPVQTQPTPEGTIAPVGEFTFCCQG